MKIPDTLPEGLYAAKNLLYDKCGFHFSMYSKEKEGREYSACTFKLNGKDIIFRTAKITPTKNGQFVTVWKRNKEGTTEPYCSTDKIDFIIISCRSDDKLGQFIFPVDVLVNQKIVSDNDNNGKRGIRVYPPWDIALSKQAAKTQSWQKKYFVLISHSNLNEIVLAKELLTQQH